MIKKIISIKNVGRFRNSASGGNTTFAKHTLILAGNGLGKTTICAILRSLKSGQADYVLGRKTLGVSEHALVDLLLNNNNTLRFNGTNWDKIYPALAVFDDVFVAENIHSGDVIEINHKRNLYRVIIGSAGVNLADEELSLSNDSRAKTTEISAATKAIQAHIPAGINLDVFISLPYIDNIDKEISNQESILSAIHQAESINSRQHLSELELPVLPDGLQQLLEMTIDDIGNDVEQVIHSHLATHGMIEAGEDWILRGIDHTTNESCPFCGQNIRGNPLIASYKALFSERFKSLSSDISLMKRGVVQLFGETFLARLETSSEQLKNGIVFWRRYCDFDATNLVYPAALPLAIRGLCQATLSLLDKKERCPLERMRVDDNFTEAKNAYLSAMKLVATLNESIRFVNVLIATKKAEAVSTDIEKSETNLIRLKAIKKRHSLEVADLCNNYSRLLTEKTEIERRKIDVRKRLEKHTETIVKPYERKINAYLDSFNAEFSITETKHGYPGGTPSSTYHLIINKTKVNLGDSKTPVYQPSFKNTLSAGDRSTLALAFFLAHIETDDGLADKIVVFDDPFNSQDAFRRCQTINNILKIADLCAQIIVLSHDATFLKQIWEKCPSGERIALTIADQRIEGSKITGIDIEKACQGRTQKDISDLSSYLHKREGQPEDIIRKIRTVLETYYHTTYPAYFISTDWLGDIVRKIREGGANHPLKKQYDSLNETNDYTKQYHHGEDLKDITPETIDPIELSGFVKQTLRIVNAMQA